MNGRRAKQRRRLRKMMNGEPLEHAPRQRCDTSRMLGWVPRDCSDKGDPFTGDGVRKRIAKGHARSLAADDWRRKHS